MRARALSLGGAALLLVATLAAGQVTRLNCGPARVGCGPGTANAPTTTTTTTSTTTTLATVVVPSAGFSDANCPATVPGAPTATSTTNTLTAVATCATGANATGYDVQAVSVYVSSGTAGNHSKCSVYTYPAGYVAGTTFVPKVAAGCDTTEYTHPGGTPNVYVTLAVTGACHLATATRYMIACNADAGMLLGATTGCTNCAQLVTSQAYATTPLPTPWQANNQTAAAMAFYLLAAPSP